MNGTDGGTDRRVKWSPHGFENTSGDLPMTSSKWYASSKMHSGETVSSFSNKSNLQDTEVFTLKKFTFSGKIICIYLFLHLWNQSLKTFENCR